MHGELVQNEISRRDVLDYFLNFIQFTIYSFVFLFPIVNPIGLAPIFLNFTKKFPKKVRRRIALSVAIKSFCLMTGTLLVGGFIMGFFGLTVPYFEVAGGAICMFVAWEMLNEEPKVSEEEVDEAASHKDHISFFPLTIPVTVGPGPIALVLSLDSKIKTNTGMFEYFDRAAAITGFFLISVVILICYRYAGIIFKYLGTIGTNVITKLSAFIIVALGFSVFWKGISTLVLELAAKAAT